MEIVHVVDVLAFIRVCMEIVYRLFDFGGVLYFIIRVHDEVRCIFVWFAFCVKEVLLSALQYTYSDWLQNNTTSSDWLTAKQSLHLERT